MSGKILTFYSFKGGVGRTMALANVAFLAALNGKRVLVMDWDLEAPGLSYYFRGTLDGSDAKALRDAPGTLDLLWGWTNAAQHNDADEIHPSLDAFMSGEAFSESVRPLVTRNILPTPAALDYIGAGKKTIAATTPIPYEDALANFSWPMFFEQYGGGVFLESFRKWAKANYDLILIDSRTGMADVAGICTMQIPDQVALCFVLNRQNIDGISSVASAIRVKRSDEVSMRLVPMRVARENTSEESDARARALSGFVRTGGFSIEAVNDDFRALAIPAADNVPFYETLAPLAASDARYDVLTLKYIKLAETFIEQPLTMPDFDQSWIDMVRRRLQPRHATTDYVAKLVSADPLRAQLELLKLVESAYEAMADGASLDDEYLSALVNAVLSVDAVQDPATSNSELQQRTVELLRALTAERPSTWSELFLRALEHFVESPDAYATEEQELVVLDELDALLSVESTSVAQIARLRYRLRAARAQLLLHDLSSAVQSLEKVSEILSLLEAKEGELDASQLDEIHVATMETFLIAGQRAELAKEFDEAVTIYEEALVKVEGEKADGFLSGTARIKTDLHNRLSVVMERKGSIDLAIHHGIKAIRSAGPLRNTSPWFIRLGRLIETSSDKDLAIDLCEAFFKGQEASSPRRYRTSQLMNPPAETLSTIVSLLELLLPPGESSTTRCSDAVMNLAYYARSFADFWARRSTKKVENESQSPKYLLEKIQSLLFEAGIVPEVIPDIFNETDWSANHPGARDAV